MSRRVVEAWKCDRADCGHVWLAKEKPKACAKCKSRKWDALGEQIVESLREAVEAEKNKKIKKILKTLPPHAATCTCFCCKPPKD